LPVSNVKSLTIHSPRDTISNFNLTAKRREEKRREEKRREEKRDFLSSLLSRRE